LKDDLQRAEKLLDAKTSEVKQAKSVLDDLKESVDNMMKEISQKVFRRHKIGS